jgi:hypothetical protein
VAKANGRLGDAAWAAMRDEYVTGNESYSELAARYGTTKSAVEKHALDREANGGRTWGEWRAEFLDGVNRETQDRVADTLATTLAQVREKTASVARKALEKLESRLDSGDPMEDKDIIAAARLATTVKVELSNDPEFPVSIKAKLDELPIEEIRKLAGES